MTQKTWMFAVAVLFAVSAFAGPVKTDAFSITLPEGFGEFSTQAQKTDSPEGKIDTTNWIAKAPTGEAVVVTVSTMPGPITDAAKAMDGMRESLLKSLNATLESEEKVDEGKAANLLFKSSGGFLRSRLVVDGSRVLQVLYVGRSEEQRNAAAVGEIFQSFRAEAPEAPEVPEVPEAPAAAAGQ
jgi:hypothetical protein